MILYIKRPITGIPAEWITGVPEKSGILLPAISLGLWHNFGDVDNLARSKDKLHYAFDHGITHFDLANNYGPSAGSAEETFGKIMKTSFAPYRDELFVFYQGRSRHVARTIRHMGITEASDSKPQPKSETNEPGLCGYLLFAPL